MCAVHTFPLTSSSSTAQSTRLPGYSGEPQTAPVFHSLSLISTYERSREGKGRHARFLLHDPLRPAVTVRRGGWLLQARQHRIACWRRRRRRPSSLGRIFQPQGIRKATQLLRSYDTGDWYDLVPPVLISVVSSVYGSV